MNYFDIYKDVWQFHKRFSKVQNTDHFWEQAKKESEAIAERYKEHQFVIDLLLAVLSELERVERRGRTQ